ncbi:MAG: hypothetical protein LBQ57_02550 [Spirochaetales bacterium]|jgi:hypothetical protein|nr:hypothetical protein [Spirochaetales bacterium]
MTHIRSALEIALEKTDDIKSDKSALAAAEGKEEGKKLASAFFQNPSMDLGGALKNIAADKLPAVKEGFVQVILANLILPRNEEDIKKLDPAAAALLVLTGNKASISSLKSQILKFFRQWLDDRKHLDETLRRQLGPMLKQKEAQIARQLGRPVKIDPLSDADYMKAYNKNMGNLENQYAGALTRVKEDVTAMLAEG